jgi:hypothetical protein
MWLMRDQRLGKRVIIPSPITRPPEIYVNTTGGTPMSRVLTLMRRVNPITEITRESAII